jgi:hypothetical protein
VVVEADIAGLVARHALVGAGGRLPGPAQEPVGSSLTQAEALGQLADGQFAGVKDPARHLSPEQGCVAAELLLRGHEFPGLLECLREVIHGPDPPGAFLECGALTSIVTVTRTGSHMSRVTG